MKKRRPRRITDQERLDRMGELEAELEALMAGFSEAWEIQEIQEDVPLLQEEE